MNAPATVANPFGSSAVTHQQRAGALAQSDQQRAIAEVQAAMMIARANPRDRIASMDRILNACARPTLADAAVYTYSRGGSDISGPSIRLAEAMAQEWGNLQFGIRELDQGNGESTVQAYAWDVETNTRREVVFQVPHTRHTKRGVTRLEDPRDIYELIANNGARRLRACILAVIPGDVTEAAVRQCEETMKQTADTTPEAQAKIVDAFAAFGVTKAQIEKRIQRRIDAIQPAQVVSLKKVYASLRDGMSAVADWFDPEQSVEDPAQAGKPVTGVSGLRANVAKAAPKDQSHPSTLNAAMTEEEATIGEAKPKAEPEQAAPAVAQQAGQQPADDERDPEQLADAVAYLTADTPADIQAAGEWADTLPAWIRGADAFTKAFRAYMKRQRDK